MWLILKLLKAYLSPGVEPGDDDTPPPDDDTPPPDDDTPPPDDDAPPQDDDTPPPDDDTPPEPRLTRAQKEIIKARERAQDAERELALAREQLNLHRSQTSQPKGPTAEQVLWEQEEAVLKNPEADAWQRYAVTANRDARAARASANQALQRTEDVADRTAFAQLAISKPNLHAAYKDKVETMLTELRARGNNAPRTELLALLVGKDTLDGKLKASAGKTTKQPAAGARVSARSDVTSNVRGSMTEADKRAKRLENVRI